MSDSLQAPGEKERQLETRSVICGQPAGHGALKLGEQLRPLLAREAAHLLKTEGPTHPPSFLCLQLHSQEWVLMWRDEKE